MGFILNTERMDTQLVHNSTKGSLYGATTFITTTLTIMGLFATLSIMTLTIECRYVEWRYAECHKAECHHAECRGTHYTILLQL
jgi:hypothetical protein